MGHEQIRILCNRRPVEEFLNDTSLDKEKRQKLEHVLKIQQYAIDIGLNPSESYRTYVELGRDAVAYNVKAVRPDSFKAYHWWFPIVGSVPYLGFFDRKSAEKKAESLEQDNWDVAVSEVAGYSTLGWFDDPLMSPQLKYSQYYLTELVLHESAHATLWLPGSVSFNESFATFFAKEATAQYYENIDAEKGKLYRLHLKEKSELTAFIKENAESLQQIYTNKDFSTQEKLLKKNEQIQTMKNDLKVRQNGWKTLSVDKMLEKDWNNAHFSSYLTYYSGQNVFNKFMIKCKNNLHCFLDQARKVSEKDIIQIENEIRN